MSFILDALKKSEAERQRQSGPTLLELRITQPRRRYPVWALWVGVLLAVNAAVLLYALLRHPASQEPVVAITSAAPPTGIVSAAPAPSSAPPVSPGVTQRAAAATPAPPAAASSATAVSEASTVAPLASAPIAANGAATPSVNPADDEPAVAAPSRAASGAAAAPDYSALPNLASLGGDIPSLQLNLLDYSPTVSERFALINMHRVHDGDVLPEGPRVLAITREGVALDYHGQQFMLRSSVSPAAP